MEKKYEVLFEDENDIFGGTPKSKFWDMLTTTHEDIGKEIIDEIFAKYAAMEAILKKDIDEDNLNKHLENYCLENSIEIENIKKSLYMEFAGDIINKLHQ